MDLVRNLAARLETRLPLCDAANDVLERALTAGLGELDLASLSHLHGTAAWTS